MAPCWGLLGSKLGVWEVQVGGFGAFLGSMLDLVGRKWSSGSSEATGKGLGRAWVGSGAAGDSDLGPTWTQLEPSWSQLGSSMGPT